MFIRLSLRFLLLVFVVVVRVDTAHAQTPAITYERYDTVITLRSDGTLLVRETQQLRFAGEYRTAFADIPTTLTTALQNIQIYEEETPYTRNGSGPNSFTIERDNDFIYVNWEYTPTQPGDVRTFVLEYEVVGGLWVYPDETILEWRAVPADRSGVLVESSAVTVTWPTAIPADQLQMTAYGPAYETTTDATSITFTATEPLPDGVQFQIQVGLPPTLIQAQRQLWQVREDNAKLLYRLPELNTELTLDPDGTLWVDEYHHLAVDDGALDQGYRQIPLRFADGIDEVQLWEGEEQFVQGGGDCAYCLQLRQTPRDPFWVYYDPDQRQVVTEDERAGALQLYWQFPPLVRGEETALRLHYRVLGAVRHLADRQEIRWTTVFPERRQPVEAAKVRFRLPPGVDRTTVNITGGNVEWTDATTALLVAPGPLAPSQAWEIAITLPVTATGSAVPQWQRQMENAVTAMQQAEIGRARLQLGLGVAALLILLLGLLGVYLIWYLWGRDRPLPAVADYLIEPPSNLPPAIVAYLLDEAPSVKGALASLFELANMGLLWVRLDDTLAVKRVTEPKLTARATLPDHLVTLFNTLEPELPYHGERPLYQIYSRFQAILPQVYVQMGEEASRFFDEEPAAARHRWLVRGQWFILLGVLGGIILALRYWGDFGLLAVAPAVAAIVAGFALVFASQWMPRRTTAGVEEAQKWRAFRTYLKNLKSYGNVEQAQRILDRYFAYAVALDVEEVVLEQATALGGALPDWSYTPTWEPPRRPTWRQDQPTIGESGAPKPGGLPPLTMPPATSGTPPATPPSGERPSLSQASKQLGQALTNASQNLGTLLSSAVGDVMPDTPFENIWQGTQTTGAVGAKVAGTTLEILGEILAESSSGGGGGGYGSSGSSGGSWSSSSSRRSSSSSGGSFSSGRSSATRRSGGGGRRGFG